MNGYTSGRLFEPKSLSFNDKVYAESIVAFGGTPYIWFGINAKGGPWVYTESGTALEFENWYPGQPDGTEDCGIIIAQFNNHYGKWFDSGCHNKLSFICEFV